MNYLVGAAVRFVIVPPDTAKLSRLLEHDDL
jgi:hypothetical protein